MAKLEFDKYLYKGRYKYLSIHWGGIGYFLIPTIYVHWYIWDFVFNIYFLKFHIRFVAYTKEGRKRVGEIERAKQNI